MAGSASTDTRCPGGLVFQLVVDEAVVEEVTIDASNEGETERTAERHAAIVRDHRLTGRKAYVNVFDGDTGGHVAVLYDDGTAVVDRSAIT